MAKADEFCMRFTVEAEAYVARYGAVPPKGVTLPRYCLRDPNENLHDVGARPLVVTRCPIQVNAPNGVPLQELGVGVFCISGDPIEKLAEYENIHCVPGVLKEIYDEYARLMQNTCYECDLYGTKDCKYPPKWGQQIRINCPFFRHQLTIEEGGLTD